LDLRRSVATALASRGHEPILFEDLPKKPNETLTRSFRDLLPTIAEGGIFVLWPKDASMHGVDWELGILGDRIEERTLDPARVILLLERGVGRVDFHANRFSIGQPGSRTRYFEDLIAWGCPISVWSTYSELLRRAVLRAEGLRVATD
jgi:hypothetical protein